MKNLFFLWRDIENDLLNYRGLIGQAGGLTLRSFQTDIRGVTGNTNLSGLCCPDRFVLPSLCLPPPSGVSGYNRRCKRMFTFLRSCIMHYAATTKLE